VLHYPMAASGQKATLQGDRHMSALPSTRPKGRSHASECHVRDPHVCWRLRITDLDPAPAWSGRTCKPPRPL